MKQYLHIPGWQEFQHYKDRNPPWVKLYYELLSSEDWVLWSDASRVLAIACVLVASRHDGKVPYNPGYLKRVAYLNTDPDFGPLLSCGFLEDCDNVLADASNMLANVCSESEPEAKTESEAERCRAEAKEVLEYLKLKSGRNFTRTADIEACLRREKCSVQDCMTVIDHKAAEWVGTHMARNLNTSTPFLPKHFQKYLDEALAGPVDTTSNQVIPMGRAGREARTIKGMNNVLEALENERTGSESIGGAGGDPGGGNDGPKDGGLFDCFGGPRRRQGNIGPAVDGEDREVFPETSGDS